MLMLPPVEEEPGLNDYPVLYWNHAGLDMNRITHSLSGPQTGPTMSSRALGLLHLAMHDAYFGALPHASYPPYQVYSAEIQETKTVSEAADGAWNSAHANEALTAAAITVLDFLYTKGGANISKLANETLTSSLSQLIKDFKGRVDVLSPQYRFGSEIAGVILVQHAVIDGPGASAGRYEPSLKRYKFRDEPVNPVRRDAVDPDAPDRGDRASRIYHGPFYGSTVSTIKVQNEAALKLDAPPEGNAAYDAALMEVIKSGGAPGYRGTVRTPDQTVAALFWAYDGANLIGTPPRLYNQIMRKVAWQKKGPTNNSAQIADATARFVRLFALINVAMADAGKFAWKEKYRFEFWRPLSGVREHDSACGPAADQHAGHAKLQPDADPFWLALGAPETNTNKVSFKPPFPAYPSGHATFGAACFQIARRFYGFDRDQVDDVSFSFVSEELNGVSRDLHQPYNPAVPLDDQPGTVRTRVVRKFASLWHAIFENAVSRVYLGVHWHFDSFAIDEVKESDDKQPKKGSAEYGTITYKDAKEIKYPVAKIGGVYLGVTIADDIWKHWQPGTPTPAAPPLSADFIASQLKNLQSIATPIR